MSISVELAYAEPNIQLILPVSIRVGATIQELLLLPEVRAKYYILDFDRVTVGVFGEVKNLDYVLVDGERVEIYRPLPVDPKEARRKRALKITK